MIAASTGAGQKLFVAYYRRRLPRFVLMQELIAKGVLGRVTSLRYMHSGPNHRDTHNPWRVDAASAGAGHFLDVGSHVLDLIDHLFGPLEDVAGCAPTRRRRTPSRTTSR